jgi:asparagine synthetase B (glutamine-hydrolysing)
VLGDETLLRGDPRAAAGNDRALRRARRAARSLLDAAVSPGVRAAPSEWVEEFGRGSARRRSARCRSQPRVGFPISGGLDSRTILAVARPSLSPSMPGFTYGVPGCDDLRLAAKLVQARRHPASHVRAPARLHPRPRAPSSSG